MDRKTWIEKQIAALSESEFVEAWNHFCDVDGDPDRMIYSMDEFDELFHDYTPCAIADLVHRTFNTSDDWFVVVNCGNTAVSDCDPRYLVSDDLDELIRSIEDNPTEFFDYLDDKDYRDMVQEDLFCGDEKAMDYFNEWFDEKYPMCCMYEWEIDDLIDGFHEDNPEE